jgi:SH3-like domain-containing protein
LVEQLQTSRGSVEPIIINHDTDKWREYLDISGKSKYQLDLQPGRSNTSLSSQKEKKKHLKSQRHNKSNSSVVTDIEVALDVANRLGHTQMKQILEDKLKALRNLEVDATS